MGYLKRQAMWTYIKKREDKQSPQFFDFEGNSCILVNHSLVYLELGAGFGELALMSDNTKRMTTC